MKTRRDQIVSQLNQFQSEVDVVMNFLKDDKVMKNMETMRDPKTLSTYLTNEFNVSFIFILHRLLLILFSTPILKILIGCGFRFYLN